MNVNWPPASKWEIDQVVALDWYDGPRSGLCRFKTPELEASFELLDERPSTDDLDERIYYLRELPTGSVQKLVGALRARCGAPQGLIWAPIWPIEEGARTVLDRLVSETLAQGRDMDVVILSRDLEIVLQVWVGQSRLSGINWFERLGL